jgi:hypothetical protein
MDAFGSRWPTTLRLIQPNGLRNEVYAAVRPDRIASSPSLSARYQGLKLAIWPHRSRATARQRIPMAAPDICIEPIPILI